MVTGLEQTLQHVQTRRFASVPLSCVVYCVQLLANADDAQPNGVKNERYEGACTRLVCTREA